jgi:hypothetical protein
VVVHCEADRLGVSGGRDRLWAIVEICIFGAGAGYEKPDFDCFECHFVSFYLSPMAVVFMRYMDGPIEQRVAG